MGRVAATWLLIVATLAVCHAAPRPAEFRTMPGGAEVWENVEGKERILARGAQGRFGDLTLPLGPSQPHALRLHRPPFNDITLTLAFDGDLGQWRVVKSNQQSSSVLQSGQTLAFNRDVRFRIEPAPAVVYRDADNTAETSTRARLVVDGVEHDVMPLQSNSREQTFRVPSAYDPPRLYLTAEGRAPLTVAFREGDLDGPADAFPATPLQWPASHGRGWLVAVVAAAGGLAVLAARRRRAPRPLIGHETWTDLAGPTATRQLPGLLGQQLRSEGGRTFEIVRQVGRGGMGAVYEARDGDLPCAVKVIHTDVAANPDYRIRFTREVSVCASLHHPNVVKVIDWGVFQAGSEEWPFMAMELVAGEDLRARLEQGPMDVESAIRVTLEALSALAVVHRAGIVHRDLKPENIMLTGSGHVKIMDFGIARAQNLTALTATDTAIGTPVYMSPEHLDAKTVTPASDLYSLGIILYEMLSGHLPFEGDELMIIIVKKLGGDFTPLDQIRPDLPPPLVEIVHRMFARAPSDRPPSAEAVMDALEDVARQRTGGKP